MNPRHVFDEILHLDSFTRVVLNFIVQFHFNVTAINTFVNFSCDLIPESRRIDSVLFIFYFNCSFIVFEIDDENVIVSVPDIYSEVEYLTTTNSELTEVFFFDVVVFQTELFEVLINFPLVHSSSIVFDEYRIFSDRDIDPGSSCINTVHHSF